jgi:amino acid permease
MVFIAVIMVGQQIFAIFDGTATFDGFIATYSGVIIFFILLFTYKIIKKTKMVKLRDMTLTNLAKDK